MVHRVGHMPTSPNVGVISARGTLRATKLAEKQERAAGCDALCQVSEGQFKLPGLGVPAITQVAIEKIDAILEDLGPASPDIRQGRLDGGLSILLDFHQIG